MTRLVAAVVCCAAIVGVASGRTRASRLPDVNDTLRLYLARHGQTDWNLERRLQGSTDIPLNATGRQQAATLARRLAGVHLDAVYSSKLQRSRETAVMVHGASPVMSLEGFNERRLGAFEGRLASPDYERRSQDPNDTLDGGESLSQFYARIRTTLDGILARHGSGAILIVGHGGTNQMIVRALFKRSPDRAASFQQGNDELYLCEIVSGTAQRLWKFQELTP
jgi:broad specificity phosphatase PhoE